MRSGLTAQSLFASRFIRTRSLIGDPSPGTMRLAGVTLRTSLAVSEPMVDGAWEVCYYPAQLNITLGT